MKAKENLTMAIDYYEFTMGQVFFDQKKTEEKAYFDIFFRKCPFEGGYAIASGLRDVIDYIENFHFSKEDIDYLRNTGDFSEDYLHYLEDLHFTGDINAIPDGTPVFPMEPLLTVRASMIEAILLETALLCYFNYGTLVATSSKRITTASGVPVMEFGSRRARGLHSAVDVFYHAYIGGCVGTSNTKAAQEMKKKAMGTMAHLLIQEADSEYEAFLDYAKSNPQNTVFLVDTYDTLRSGIPNAIRVANDYLKPNGYHFDGIRIDSGDLAYLSKEARKMLDEAGYQDTKICLSNGLNEEIIEALKREGAMFDGLGVGDNIAASKERMGCVYKLAATLKDGKIIPKIKVSEDAFKTTNPGSKKVYRFYDKKEGYALGDVIALANEKIPLDQYTLISEKEPFKRKTITNYRLRELQEPIFRNGELVYAVPSMEETRTYCEKEFETLYSSVTRHVKPHEYYVDLSEKLMDLKQKLIEGHKKQAQDTKL